MVFLSRKVDGNIIFTDYWKVLVLIFLGTGNMVFFWAKKLMERWYLLITEEFLFWTFRWWEIRSFFESRSWWKDDIYWLLKSSCFELFGDRNRVFFWVKKLIKRWYLLVTEKFLFWTLRWWEIRSFFQPKSWWKDDICLVFLSFPWYSRTRETLFFPQCILYLFMLFVYLNNCLDHLFTLRWFLSLWWFDKKSSFH